MSKALFYLLEEQMEQTATNLRNRPLGVTIIAVLLAIGGILEILGGILIFAGIFAIGHAIVGHGHTTTGHVLDAAGTILAIIPLIIGVLTLIFAVGFLLLKRWAFWLTVIIEAISLIRHALEFTQASHPPTGLIVVEMIIPV